MAFPWLVGVAFNIVFGSLFVKSVNNYGVHTKSQDFEKLKLNPLILIGWLSVFVVIEAVSLYYYIITLEFSFL
jgi:hypothetical protein